MTMGLVAPSREEGDGPMGQKVVTTTPITSACAAITSIMLAAVSNIRMGKSPMPAKYPASQIW